MRAEGPDLQAKPFECKQIIKNCIIKKAVYNRRLLLHLLKLQRKILRLLHYYSQTIENSIDFQEYTSEGALHVIYKGRKRYSSIFP